MTTDLRSACPIAASLDILGDRWTLVVLRDMLLGGRSRFSEFAVDESIATNVLSDRLHRLYSMGELRLLCACSGFDEPVRVVEDAIIEMPLLPASDR